MKWLVLLLAILSIGGCNEKTMLNYLGEYAPTGATGFNGWTTPLGGTVVDAVDTFTMNALGPQLTAITFGVSWAQAFPTVLVAGKQYRWFGTFRWIGTPPADSGNTTDVLFRVTQFDTPTSSTVNTIVTMDVNEDHNVDQSFSVTFTAKGNDFPNSFDGLLIQGQDQNGGTSMQLQFSKMVLQILWSESEAPSGGFSENAAPTAPSPDWVEQVKPTGGFTEQSSPADPTWTEQVKPAGGFTERGA